MWWHDNFTYVAFIIFFTNQKDILSYKDIPQRQQYSAWSHILQLKTKKITKTSILS